MSPKCFYAHKKGPSKAEYARQEVKDKIVKLQEDFGKSLGYRKLTYRLEDDYDIDLSQKNSSWISKGSESFVCCAKEAFFRGILPNKKTDERQCST